MTLLQYTFVGSYQEKVLSGMNILISTSCLFPTPTRSLLQESISNFSLDWATTMGRSHAPVEFLRKKTAMHCAVVEQSAAASPDVNVHSS